MPSRYAREISRWSNDSVVAEHEYHIRRLNATEGAGIYTEDFSRWLYHKEQARECWLELERRGYACPPTLFEVDDVCDYCRTSYTSAGSTEPCGRSSCPFGTPPKDRSCRYRLCDAGPNNAILDECDTLGTLTDIIAARETNMHDEPMRPGEVLQILRRNDATQKYDVLFTIVRGNAY